MANRSNYWLRARGSTQSRRTFLRGSAAAGLGIGSMVAVGCGDDDDDSSPPTQSGTTASGASPSVQGGGEPAPGGIAVFATAGRVTSFDANRVSGGFDVMAPTGSRLIEYKRPVSELAGDLAKSLPEQPDDVTYVFKLKDDIYWHEKEPVNGRRFTSDDVRYYIERQAAGKDIDGKDDPSFLARSQFQRVGSIETPDDNTITIKLNEPFSPMLDVFAGFRAYLIAREAAETFTNDEWTSLDPRVVIGTGPYVLESYQEGLGAKYSKFNKYYDAGFPRADGLIIREVFADPATADAALRQKQVDFWESPRPEIAESIRNDEAGIIATDIGSNRGILYQSSSAVPPMNDPRIQRALWLAFNRRQIIAQLYSGAGLPSLTFPWPLSEWHLPQSELVELPGFREDHSKDAAEARALWQAASGPAEFKVHINEALVAAYSVAAEAIPQSLSESLGIKVTAEVITSVQASQTLQSATATTGIYNIASLADTPDPTNIVWRCLSSKSQVNDFYGHNRPGGLQVPGLEGLTDKLLITLDNEERKQIVQDIQRLQTEEAFAIGQIINPINTLLAWSYIRDVELGAVQYGALAKRLWLDQSDPDYSGRPTPS